MVRRESDPEDLPVEKMRSASISKDWLIGILVTVVGALLTIGVHNLNAQNAGMMNDLGDHAVRLNRLEEVKSETYRRLENIDNKLDTIIGWKNGR